MSTDRRRTGLAAFRHGGGGIILAIAILGALFVPLYRVDPSMGVGLLWGGGLTLLAASVALWRSRTGRDVGAVERHVGGVGDERDSLVMTHTWAIGGRAALAWSTIALTASALGAIQPMHALTLTLWAQIVTLVIAYLVMARRH